MTTLEINRNMKLKTGRLQTKRGNLCVRVFQGVALLRAGGGGRERERKRERERERVKERERES